MNIGVSGAGGQLGRAVVRELGVHGAGHEIVAITRKPEAIEEGLEARLGDYDRPETLATAYGGLERLLLIPSADLRPGVRGAQITAAVDAAVAAGVGQVFLLSATGVREIAEPALGAAYWAGERRLMRSDVAAWTILRMNYFSETFAEQAGMAAALGHVPGLAENRVAFVSREDVAAACAAALIGEGHAGGTYNLSGPDRITGAERAALVAEHAGKPVTFQVMTKDALRAAMGPAGLPPFVVDAVVSLQAAEAGGAYDIVTGDVERLSGHAPRTLRSVLSGAAA